ncbi:MAG: 16S rRNA (uracil(1498)-N(3))-methyltransferase [Candidatus Oxydemutatoraceae bacterium WSBS_2016_MAG_OTU14]
MRLSRIYLDQSLALGETVSVTDSKHHYITHVLRLSAGDKIYLFNGSEQFAGSITKTHRQSLDVLCEEACSTEPAPTVTIDLYLAIARSASMDFAIQKATELGIRDIQLLRTEHSQSLSKSALPVREKHWQKVAISAAEQCGRTTVPSLKSALPLKEVRLSNTAYAFVPTATKSFVQSLSESPQASLSLMIGPEGDFSQADLEHIQNLGIEPVQIGTRILRVETAVITAMSIVHTVCGDFV